MKEVNALIKETKKRGFGGMTIEKRRQIASLGGKKAHALGVAHKYTSEEAREAGKKGGSSAQRKGTAHQFSSEEAREAGKKGGASLHKAK